MKPFPTLVLSIALMAIPGHAAVVLSTDFSGRTISGNTASSITWSTDGISLSPSNATSLTASTTNIHDTTATAGRFVPVLNIGSTGNPWTAEIEFTVTAQSVELTGFYADMYNTNNSGAEQSSNVNTQVTLEVFDSGDNSLGLISDTTGSYRETSADGFVDVDFVSSITLTQGNTYSFLMTVQEVSSPGHHSGFGTLSYEGIVTPVPEPSIALLSGLGLIPILRRHRA